MAVETLYSDAADARVSATDGTWATARGASTGTLQSASTNPTGVNDTLEGDYYILRFFMFFASSASGTVSAVTFSFEVNTAPTGTSILHLVGSSQANPVVADDYNNLDFTSFGSVSFSTTGVKSITLNASGIAYVNANLGSTIKLALIGNADQSNTPPTDASEYCVIYTGDEAVQQKPKLEITYSTSSIKTVIGLAKESVKTVNGVAIASVKSINGLS